MVDGPGMGAIVEVGRSRKLSREMFSNGTRVVKKLMRPQNGSISTARPRVPYCRLRRRHDFLLFRRLEITVCCLSPEEVRTELARTCMDIAGRTNG